jgi:hypothetical protein
MGTQGDSAQDGNEKHLVVDTSSLEEHERLERAVNEGYQLVITEITLIEITKSRNWPDYLLTNLEYFVSHPDRLWASQGIGVLISNELRDGRSRRKEVVFSEASLELRKLLTSAASDGGKGLERVLAQAKEQLPDRYAPLALISTIRALSENLKCLKYEYKAAIRRWAQSVNNCSFTPSDHPVAMRWLTAASLSDCFIEAHRDFAEDEALVGLRANQGVTFVHHLCMFAMASMLFGLGIADQANDKTLENHVRDLDVLATSACADGLLTQDTRLKHLHTAVASILSRWPYSPGTAD